MQEVLLSPTGGCESTCPPSSPEGSSSDQSSPVGSSPMQRKQSSYFSTNDMLCSHPDEDLSSISYEVSHFFNKYKNQQKRRAAETNRESGCDHSENEEDNRRRLYTIHSHDDESDAASEEQRRRSKRERRKRKSSKKRRSKSDSGSVSSSSTSSSRRDLGMLPQKIFSTLAAPISPLVSRMRIPSGKDLLDHLPFHGDATSDVEKDQLSDEDDLSAQSSRNSPRRGRKKNVHKLNNLNDSASLSASEQTNHQEQKSREKNQLKKQQHLWRCGSSVTSHDSSTAHDASTVISTASGDATAATASSNTSNSIKAGALAQSPLSPRRTSTKSYNSWGTKFSPRKASDYQTNILCSSEENEPASMPEGYSDGGVDESSVGNPPSPTKARSKQEEVESNHQEDRPSLEERKKQRAERLKQVKERIRLKKEQEAAHYGKLMQNKTVEERSYLAYEWYMRCGMPSRSVMKQRLSYEHSSYCWGITEEDIDLLAWSPGGGRVMKPPQLVTRSNSSTHMPLQERKGKSKISSNRKNESTPSYDEM